MEESVKRTTVINGKKVEDYLRILEDLEQERSPWIANWDEIAPYVLPRREVKTSSENQ